MQVAYSNVQWRIISVQRLARMTHAAIFQKQKYVINFCFLHPKNHQTKIHYLCIEKYDFCCIKNHQITMHFFFKEKYVFNPSFFLAKKIITNYFLKKLMKSSVILKQKHQQTIIQWFSKENVSIKELNMILADLDLKDLWIFYSIQWIQKVS